MAAMTGSQNSVEAMVAEFRQNRELLVDGLNKIEGFVCHKPLGAFYAYPNVTRVCRQNGFKDSKELQQYLLYEAGVAVLGQQCFATRPQDEDQEYIRLSYVSSGEDLREALRRIGTALGDKGLMKSFLERKRKSNLVKS